MGSCCFTLWLSIPLADGIALRVHSWGSQHWLYTDIAWGVFKKIATGGTVPQRFWFNSSEYPWAWGFLKVHSPGYEGLDWGGGGLEEEEGRKRERSSFDFWSQQRTLLEQRLLSDDEKWAGSIYLRAHLKKEPWVQKQACFNGLIMHTLVFPNDFI